MYIITAKNKRLENGMAKVADSIGWIYGADYYQRKLYFNLEECTKQVHQWISENPNRKLAIYRLGDTKPMYTFSKEEN